MADGPIQYGFAPRNDLIEESFVTFALRYAGDSSSTGIIVTKSRGIPRVLHLAHDCPHKSELYSHIRCLILYSAG